MSFIDLASLVPRGRRRMLHPRFHLRQSLRTLAASWHGRLQRLDLLRERLTCRETSSIFAFSSAIRSG